MIAGHRKMASLATGTAGVRASSRGDRVPYYREHWAERRRQGDPSSWEHLENWPVLEKEIVRRQPRSFVADDCDIKRMFYAYTSGTTGTPVDLWRSRKTMRSLYALSIGSHQRLAGRRPGIDGPSWADRWSRPAASASRLSGFGTLRSISCTCPRITWPRI